MKRKSLFTIVLSCTIIIVSAQTEQSAKTVTLNNPTESIVYSSNEVDSLPQYPGKRKELYKYLSDNLRLKDSLPDFLPDANIHVGFIVKENGQLDDINIIKSGSRYKKPEHSAIDMEILQLFNSMPLWHPATKDGKIVSCYLTIPINKSELRRPYTKEATVKTKSVTKKQYK